MKLHTNLTGAEVREALSRAEARGLVAADVHFVTWDESVSSRTHPHGIDFQLGTYDKHSLPPGTKDQHGHKMHVRKFKNTGNRGANSDSEWAGNEGIWAATWHEWGWFITEVFAADPAARFGSNPARCARPEYAWGYASPADFHARTGYQFTDLPPLPPAPPSPPAHLAVPPRYAPGPAADPVVFGPAGDMPVTTRDRLEYLRGELRAELQNLAGYIEPGDTELLEAAGVPEHEAGS